MAQQKVNDGSVWKLLDEAHSVLSAVEHCDTQ
jgi:hypothetical protein